MFGIGMPEMILILAVALIVIGPKKLPDLAKSLGKAMGEFKKATSDLKESMQIDTELKEVKNTFETLEKDIRNEANRHKGQTDEKPADAAVADETPVAGKPKKENTALKDDLKADVDCRDKDASDVDKGVSDDTDTPPRGSEPDSETRKG